MRVIILSSLLIILSCATGKCFYSDCGCPGSFLAGWCSDLSFSPGWCSDSSTNCAACSGVWCTGELTYAWAVSVDYPSPCKTACGSAAETQTRTIVCRGSDGSVDESKCDAASKPESQRTCPAIAVTYAWAISVDYTSACKTACGSDAEVQTRTIVCRGCDGSDADHSKCDAASKPESQRTCPAIAVTYAWAISVDYTSACKTCGSDAEVQTRTIVCRNCHGSNAADSNCDAANKLESQRTCPATSPCGEGYTPITDLFKAPIQSGEGTFFTQGTGGCEMHNSQLGLDNSIVNVAISIPQHFTGFSCGMCVEVLSFERNDEEHSMPAEKFTAFVMDRCDGCAAGDLDFARPEYDGRHDITWKAVPCPVSAPMKFKAQGHADWIRIQVQDTRYPVHKLEVMNCGSYKPLKMLNGAFSEQNHLMSSCLVNGVQGQYHTPLKMKVTDVYGQTVEDELPSFSLSYTTQQGSKGAQFPLKETRRSLFEMLKRATSSTRKTKV